MSVNYYKYKFSAKYNENQIIQTKSHVNMFFCIFK